MPLGGLLPYDEPTGVSQDQGDMADTVYQGADADQFEAAEPGEAKGGCDCSGMGTDAAELGKLLQNPQILELMASLLEGQGGVPGAAEPVAGEQDPSAMMGGGAPPMGMEAMGGMPEEEDASTAALFGGQ